MMAVVECPWERHRVSIQLERGLVGYRLVG